MTTHTSPQKQWIQNHSEYLALYNSYDRSCLSQVVRAEAIAWMRYTGLRINTTLEMKIGWVKLNTGIPYIHLPAYALKWAKKDEKLPLNEEAVVAYLNMLDEHPTPTDRNAYLFPAVRKVNGEDRVGRLANKDLRKSIYRKSLDTVPSVYGGLKPHMLRRTFANVLKQNGTPIEDISLLLLHKSVSTTQEYLLDDWARMNNATHRAMEQSSSILEQVSMEQPIVSKVFPESFDITSSKMSLDIEERKVLQMLLNKMLGNN